MLMLCFNSGGQAAANSPPEGAPRGASRRIQKLMASLEHSPARSQIDRLSWSSPGAACQAPCPLRSSCPSFFSLQVSPGLEGVRTGRCGKARECAFNSLRLSAPITGFFSYTHFPPNNEKWPLGYSDNNNNNKIIATMYWDP